jgi:hypothetical protein
MTTRPILFDGEMVRAILDARKNQTRRPIESVLGIGRVRDFGPVDRPRSFDWAMRDRRGLWHEMMHDELLARCPYGQRGDRLYVRETVRADELKTGLDGVRYQADGLFIPIENSQEAGDLWLDLYRYDGHDALDGDPGANGRGPGVG